TVRRTNPRRKDGATFVRVKLLDGPRAGAEDWDSGLWELGTGILRRACLDCGFPFYTDASDQTFCPACDRPGDRRPEYAPGVGPRPHRHRMGPLMSPSRTGNDTGE